MEATDRKPELLEQLRRTARVPFLSDLPFLAQQNSSALKAAIQAVPSGFYPVSAWRECAAYLTGEVLYGKTEEGLRVQILALLSGSAE